MSAEVHVKPFDVSSRLAQLGVPEIALRTAVGRGQLAVDNCTANHPRMYAPFAGWAETVRGLRDEMGAERWTNSDDRGYALCIDPTGKIAIAVATGNEQTGVATGNPSTKASKGPSTLEAVLVNARQLGLFEALENAPAPAAPAHVEQEKRATWILLFHRAGDETRAELSLPVAFGEGDRVTAWRERIILGPIARDPQSLRIEPPDLPDLDVHVKRRA